MKEVRKTTVGIGAGIGSVLNVFLMPGIDGTVNSNDAGAYNRKTGERVMSVINIRNAALDDAERLLEIYSFYIQHTAISFEYDVPTIDEFRERIRRTAEKYPYLVIEKNGRILGYAYAGPFKGRAAYSWSCELTIYLDRDARGVGLGRELYSALEGRLKAMGFLNLYACIAYPETEDEYLTANSADFHAHLGFIEVGRFHKCGYKFGRWYDMIWMEKIVGDHHSITPAYIRKLRSDETDLLKDFLYEAIFVPEGVTPPDRSIICQPELSLYYNGFGNGSADNCLVAEVDGKVVGAVWTRIMNDYGHVSDDTPSFAISLYKEYRGQGIGTALMHGMLELLKEQGFQKASLAVQKANYAVRMYEAVGFKTIDENEEEYIMVCDL